MHGEPGGATGADDALASNWGPGIGAEIMGRNKFGPQRGPWTDDEWRGWWGDDDAAPAQPSLRRACRTAGRRHRPFRIEDRYQPPGTAQAGCSSRHAPTVSHVISWQVLL